MNLALWQNDGEFARQLDKNDPLKGWRNEFIIPQRSGRDQIYFLGNSLGLQPKTALGKIQETLTQWADYGVEGFFEGPNPWKEYHNLLTPHLAKITGALPHELVVMNSLTVNLHLMLVSFYRPKGKRIKIICEAGAFPSDQYMLETHVKHLGYHPDDVIVEVKPRPGHDTIQMLDVLETIKNNGEELALVLWGGVNYYTGQLFDIKAITQAAHEAGAHAGFDLAHAAGNVKLDLHDWDADFACWCSYKYLNSGPGAIGGVYIHERFHAHPEINRFAGWWGYKKETRFLMQKGFQPSSSAEGWQLSTPSAILYATHLAALEQFSKVGFDALILKGQRLSAYMHFLINDMQAGFTEPVVKVLTPEDQDQRGCQISLLMLKEGKKIFKELSENGVFADWREPNVIRVAPVPLYNSYTEIWQFVDLLRKVLQS